MHARAIAMSVFLLIIGHGTSWAQTHEETPSPSEVRRAVVKMLREESLTESQDAKHDALVELCDAYVAIRLHPLYANSEVLQGEAVRVRRRLISEASRLEDRLQREKIVRPSSLRAQVDHALESSDLVEQSETASIRNGEGGAAIGNEGWELVELIQRTVHPDFWEAQGGPGSIRYFAMKRVLVVRATTQVHEDLVRLLRQL